MSSNTIKYIERHHILDLYRQLYGSQPIYTCLRPDLLDKVLEDMHNDGIYPLLEDKATHLFCGILHNHPFTDGNKVMSIQITALFLIANGYSNVIERFVGEMFRFMPHIARGLMGEELIRDIVTSIITEDTDYPESLKVRIYFAIEEDLQPVDENIANDTTVWFHFEKQTKLTQRADNRNSVDANCSQYPCIKLVFNDDWNDLGHHTWFSVWYIADKTTLIYIGDTKIMHRDDSSYKHMPESFDRLDEQFCSLGLNIGYYQKMLNVFGRQDAKRLLEALRDSATDNLIHEVFRNTGIYKISLLRDISSERALHEAPFILENRKKSEAYSFTYNFIPIYNPEYEAAWRVNIDYDALPYKRTFAIIGENAVGKTQLMTSLMRDLTSEEGKYFDNIPMLSSLLVICSSTYDSYNGQKPQVCRIPLDICSVVQDTETQDRLTTAIENIIKRGTIYKSGGSDSIYNRYRALLDRLLLENVSSRLFTEEGDGEYKKIILQNDSLASLIDVMSTGQLQIFSLITYVCAYIHLNSLVIIDEPEVHLHPKMITQFFRVLNKLLCEFQGYAFVATHSPLVVRECVDSNVYMMVRNQYDEPIVKAVPFRTFGEDISVLYENIFGCEEQQSCFYHQIVDMTVNPTYTFQDICDALTGQGVHLSMNVLNVISRCIQNRKETIQ